MIEPSAYFDEVLAECLDALELGNWTPAALAARYPEFPGLADLLVLAIDLRSIARARLDLGRDPEAGPAGWCAAGHLDDQSEPRRIQTRVLVALAGTARLYIPGRRSAVRSFPIRTVDLSHTGLGFETVRGLDPGARLEIALRLPSLVPGRSAEVIGAILQRWARRTAARSSPGRLDPARPALPIQLTAAAQVVYCTRPIDPAEPEPAGYRAGAVFLPTREPLAGGVREPA